jgi:CRISPR-associated endoribonuclease Cas6
VDFNFLKLIITLRLEADIANPYLLFGIKTDFADFFRQVTGCRGKSCRECAVPPACPYWQVFSQTLSGDPSAVKRFQKPPLPFVFDLPLLPPSPNRGRTVEVGLILAGPAANHVVCFLDAVRLMFGGRDSSRKVLAVVSKVESVDYTGNRSAIAGGDGVASLDRLFSLSLDSLEKSVTLSPDRLQISIVTPLRLLHEGKVVEQLSFSVLARSLLRRMSAMLYYYGGIELELDYKWLAEQSSRITIDSGEFSRAEWGRGLGGIIGGGTFAGDVAEFHLVLLFGEQFHAGKGATYGLGRFRLEKAG